MCVTSSQRSRIWCPYDGVTTQVTSNYDTLAIDCPRPPGLPEVTRTIPLRTLSNVGSSPAGCNCFAYQIGCESGNCCLAKGYENNRGEKNSLDLVYPVLEKRARLRVRQTNTARTSWRVTIQDSVVGHTSAVYDQFQRSWLEVRVSGTATWIALEASCFYYRGTWGWKIVPSLSTQ